MNIININFNANLHREYIINKIMTFTVACRFIIVLFGSFSRYNFGKEIVIKVLGFLFCPLLLFLSTNMMRL